MGTPDTSIKTLADKDQPKPLNYGDIGRQYSLEGDLVATTISDMFFNIGLMDEIVAGAKEDKQSLLARNAETFSKWLENIGFLIEPKRLVSDFLART